MSGPRREPSDWLSPVLVKEMRQGLKGRAFVAVFLVLHGALLASMIFGLTQNTPMQMRQVSTSLFWTVTVTSLLVFVPGLGMNAVTVEMKAHTFELMVLTRLSAWRVIVGKWSCVVAQAGLVVSSLMPYLVVRYFLGGVNLVVELVVLLGVVLVSALLVAVAVFVSTYDNQLARLGLLGVMGLSMIFSLGLASSMGSGPGVGLALGGATTLSMAAVGLLLGLALLFFVLQAAATRVAPASENHAAAKRGVALVALLLLLVPLPEDFREGLLAFAVPLLVFVCLDGCGERISASPSTYLFLVRRLRGLRGLALGLYPGWPSALLFTGLVSAALGVVLYFVQVQSAAQAIIAGLSFFSVVILPTAVARAFGRAQTVGLFALVIHLVLILAALMATEAAQLVASGLPSRFFAVIVPVTSLGIAVAKEVPQELVAASALAMVGWSGLSGLLLMWRARADVFVTHRTAQRAVAVMRGPGQAETP